MGIDNTIHTTFKRRKWACGRALQRDICSKKRLSSSCLSFELKYIIPPVTETSIERNTKMNSTYIYNYGHKLNTDSEERAISCKLWENCLWEEYLSPMNQRFLQGMSFANKISWSSVLEVSIYLQCYVLRYMDISNVPIEIAFILSNNIALLLPVLCSIFTEATILGQKWRR